MSKSFLLFFISVVSSSFLFASGPHPDANIPLAAPVITVATPALDTIPPIQDRTEDFVNTPNENPFDLKDPAVIEKDVEYDVTTGQYIISEKLGEDYFRAPTYMSFEEYTEYRAKQQEKAYFNSLAGVNSNDDNISGRIDPISKLQSEIENNLVNRLFGGTEVSIQPQGNIDLTFGGFYQNNQNPTLEQRRQRQGGFDFDMDIRMNVEGKIGDKLNLSTNYNTQATFDFENQLNLGYASDAFSEDDIIKNIEAGNVSLPLNGTLIQGSQNLFGLRTDLQFGYLKLSLLAAQQKSRRENIQLEGGAQVQEFEVFADEYDENRNFFLSHYNYETFEESLRNLPQINSLFRISKIQVWVTNDRNAVDATDNIREIVAIADLGESERTQTIPRPASPPNQDIFGRSLPANNSNFLERELLEDQEAHLINNVVKTLESAPFNLQQIKDYEKVRARMLSPSEFNYNPDLGFVSINVNVRPNQVLGVAFEYTYNGRVFRVGEFANDVAESNSDGDICTEEDPNVLFVKMLKSSANRVDLPMWGLMMKNVYNIGAYQVDEQEFRMEVLYQDPGRGDKRFIPAPELTRFPLIRLLNLDNLNILRDPQPDGVFDYVEGLTINPQNGRVMFPVLEPFGSSLERQIRERVDNSARADQLVRQYTFPQLYDSTLFRAKEYPELNRFILKGEYKSSVSSEISLGAFNLPEGAERITAGGQLLVRGKDYTIDYNIGRVVILNDAILNSGVPINVSFEDNSLFGFQSRTMLGVRADYELGKDASIGATYMQLFERPFTQKVNFGEDPINNRVYGLDFNFQKPAPWLTKALDALPFYSTKAESSISLSAEFAALKPGHARGINQADDEGAVYLDDFEGTTSSILLGSALTNWALSSVPARPGASSGRVFPEARLIDDIRGGVNRAKLNWYSLEFTISEGADNPYTRQVITQEIFENEQSANFGGFGNNTERILDLYYDPTTRGPYNFDVPGGTQFSAGMAQNGRLLEPESRWAGITQAIRNNTDFQTSNVEFIEFWMLSPFIENQGGGGEIVFNLGNVSEDILRDSRRFYESGLPTDSDVEEARESVRAALNNPADSCKGIEEELVATTNWARVPRDVARIGNFSNEDNARSQQDLGFDGFNDSMEIVHYNEYVTSLNEAVAAGTLNPEARDEILRDVSNDNFTHFRDYVRGTSVQERYSRFNGPQGNNRNPNRESTVTGFSNGISAQGNRGMDDDEDLDQNNSLNETEAYFEYRIPVEGDGQGGIELNEFITDVEPGVETRDGQPTNWYRFKIPLNQPTGTVGGISDFRAIRFVRMYMTGFRNPRYFRMARLELVSNRWRRYTRELSTLFGIPTNPPLQANFDVNTVNINENGKREPFAYVLPPRIVRENSLGNFPQALQNEQSLSITVCDLPDGDARALFKPLDLDMRVYENLRMFVHAEDQDGLAEYERGEVELFMRLGSDFEENYYEYQLPLTMSDADKLPINTTGSNTLDPVYVEEVWIPENQVDIPLDSFISIKKRRNAIPGADINVPFVVPFEEQEGAQLSVLGNPNLGLVKGVMIGVRNKRDNGAPICTEVWVNELRLSGFDERGGQAGLARLDLQLADLGNATVAGNFSTIGWGQLEDKVNERARERYLQYDLSANLELGKFLPEKSGIKIPFYAQHSVTTYTPEFDPYDLDIPLKDKLKSIPASQRDSVKQQAQEYNSISTVNFSNVRKEKTNDTKPMPWDISNFSASYNHTKTVNRNALIENDQTDIYRGGIDYSFSWRPKYIQPFKKIKNKNLKFIKELNLNPLPNSFTFNTMLDRHLQQTSYRFVEEEFKTFFIRKFLWNRNYDVKWDLMKALKLNFRAENLGVIDELDAEGNTLDGQLYDGSNRDYIWENLRMGGRNKNYYHSINASFNVPLKNFPFLDFMTFKAQYNATYDWSRASVNADSLGNVIQNSSSRQVTFDVNFDKLYNKSKYLKEINGRGGRGRKPKRTTSNNRRKKTDDKDDKKGKKDKKEKKEREVTGLEKALIRPLLLLKKARLNYSENFGSVIPGFTPESQLFGQQDFSAPGWDYVLGVSPDDAWLDRASDRLNGYQNPWITDNVFMNQQVIRDYQQKIDARVTLEPVRDLRLELTANRTYQENHTQFFKDTLRNNETIIESVNERDIGSMSVSYFALKTLFENDIKDVFRTFEAYRAIISERLDDTGLAHTSDNAGFKFGYGQNSQDVLIPAFLAAYTGTDPNTTTIYDDARKFRNIMPRPNWRLTYNGLAKIKGLDEIFQNVSITHGYKSTLTVNSFNTNFQYDNQNPRGLDNINPQSNNYYTRFEIPAIVIDESFAPLLGVDMRMKNGMSIRLDFKKARRLSFSLLTSELDEDKMTEYVFGFGHRIKDVNIGFLQFGAPKKKKKKKGDEAQQEPPGALPGGRRRGGGASQPNDLNIKFDFSFRDDVTIKHILDELKESDPTRGSTQIRVSPSIDYNVNSQLNLRLFVDYNMDTPKTSIGNTLGTTNVRGGLTVRFSLN
ncbi:MAG: cell surface protein SprA [Bacteroidota bacterium]